MKIIAESQGLYWVYLRPRDKPTCSHKYSIVSWRQMCLRPHVFSSRPWWKLAQIAPLTDCHVVAFFYYYFFLLFFSCITSCHLVPLIQRISGIAYIPEAANNLAIGFLLVFTKCLEKLRLLVLLQHYSYLIKIRQ